MPVVRIADDVWGELKRGATPLEDNVNKVLRCILGLPEPGSMPSASQTRPLPQGAYRRPILEVLVELGGQGKS